jgi:O-succinylbenzoate synthase
MEVKPKTLEDWHRNHPFIRGHSMARSAVIMAIMDLSAKQREQALGTFYGADRNEAYSGISIGLQDETDELLRRVDRSLDRGYGRIKIKIEPGRDVHLLGAIRNEFPDIDLMADGNGGYEEKDLNILQQLDDYDLMMLEQPFPPSAFRLHAQLQSQIDTPICLDESIETMDDAERASREDSARVINIKQPRVAGPANALRMYQYCVEEDLQVFCGGLLETGIGRAHNVALASLPAFEMPGDISESKRYFPEDVVEPEFELTNRGTLQLPDEGAGISVSPKMDFIRKMSVRTTRFE